MSQHIIRKINELAETSGHKVDLATSKSLHHENTQILSHIKSLSPDSIIANCRVASMLRDLPCFVHLPDTGIDGILYKIGTVDGINIFVDPYKAWCDNSVLVVKNISENTPPLTVTYDAVEYEILDEYGVQNDGPLIFKLKTPSTSLKTALDSVISGNCTKEIFGGIDKRIFVSLAGSEIPSPATIEPENKEGVLEFFGYSLVDGEPIFRLFGNKPSCIAELTEKISEGISYHDGANTGTTGSLGNVSIDLVKSVQQHVLSENSAWKVTMTLRYSIDYIGSEDGKNSFFNKIIFDNMSGF